MKKNSALLIVLGVVFLVAVLGVIYFNWFFAKPDLSREEKTPVLYSTEAEFIKLAADMDGKMYFFLRIAAQAGGAETKRGEFLPETTKLLSYSSSGQGTLKLQDLKSGEKVIITSSQDPRKLKVFPLESISKVTN